MSSFFAWPDEVDTIVFDPEEGQTERNEVDVKRCLSGSDIDTIDDARINLRLKPEALDKEKVLPSDFEDIEVRSTNSLLLELCIKAWRGPAFADREGKPMPVSKQSIGLLRGYVRDRLLKEIRSRNKELKKA